MNGYYFVIKPSKYCKYIFINVVNGSVVEITNYSYLIYMENMKIIVIFFEDDYLIAKKTQYGNGN